MNLTVAALLGLSLSQPPANEYFPYNKRTFTLPISFGKDQDRKNIRVVKLFVSADQGATWSQDATAPPTQESFQFTAKQDGPYWFHVQVIDMQGRTDPQNLTVEPPAQKVLVDTVPPQVRFRTAKRKGDKGEEVAVEWTVEDKYPNDEATRVFFRAASAPDTAWQEVTLHPTSRSGVQFPVGTGGAIVVKVQARDLGGNENVGLREIPAFDAVAPLPHATSISATIPANPPPPPVGAMTRGTAIPPPAGVVPTETQPPAGPVAPTAPPATVAPAYTPAAANTFLAVGSGTVAATPTVEMSRAQAINYLRFDLGYEVERSGPSGISRADLWLTRDDGKKWVRWSQHDGRDASIRVELDARPNTPREQLEGAYGFRVVPVSGAGLSDGAPANGDAPDMRVLVDLTPPVVGILPPGSDPIQRDTLEIRWEATDKNFGEDPITLEWCERPNGPWQPVLAGGPDGVVQATAVAGLAPRRLPNTGKYAWRVPAGLPAKVYLKVSARDAAGNVSEVVTPQPITIDLMKPRAKITSIGANLPGQRP